MSGSFRDTFACLGAAALVATLGCGGSALAGPSLAGHALVAADDPGKIEISKSGTGLLVKVINPPNGTATSFRSYEKEKASCGNHEAPCFVFSGSNGTASMPVEAPPCSVDTAPSGAQTAYCPAASISSVEIYAPTGGTIGYDASDASELGKNCFPVGLNYEVGPKGQYSVLAWDGCKEVITCEAHQVGTVDADDKDVIKGPCYFVKRH